MPKLRPCFIVLMLLLVCLPGLADANPVARYRQPTLGPVQHVVGAAGQSLIRFSLKQAFEADKVIRYLTVTSVTDGDGRALPFDQAKEHLVVQLVTPTQPGRPVQLRFEYGGAVLFRPGGDNYWELGVGEAWFPTFDPLASLAYTFHGTVRTGGGWRAFLPGELVRRDQEGALERVETRSAKPICTACILGGAYFLEEETRDGITVRIATYASKLGSARKVLMDQSFNVMAYYRPFLGPFPFKEFLIVEKNDWGYGQAPAGMMFITQEAFNQQMYHHHLEESAHALGSQNLGLMKTMDVRHIFAHELAHQYWGTVVRMPSWEDQWLTESFADYCATLYDRDTKGKSYYSGDVNGFIAKKDYAPFMDHYFWGLELPSRSQH